MVELQRGRDKKKFIYQQIADSVEAAVRDGRYQTGERLPSLDEMALSFAVNKLTMVKAVKELNARGIVRTVPVRGSFVAESERSATIRRVGVISMVMVPGNSGYYHMLMLDFLQKALSDRDIAMLQLPSARQSPEKILRHARESRADAFLLIGHFPEKILRLLLEEFPNRIVLLDDASDRSVVDSVTQKGEACVRQALLALCPPGRSGNIAVIRGASDQPVTAERMCGVEQAKMENPGMTVRVYNGDYLFESGRREMRKILAEPSLPDGVFCMNDEMALGALSVVHERNVKLPDAFWLLGYDDVPSAEVVGLSTIAAPLSDMVEAVVSLLLRRCQSPGAPEIQQCYSPRTVWRRTAVPVGK